MTQPAPKKRRQTAKLALIDLINSIDEARAFVDLEAGCSGTPRPTCATGGVA